MLRLWQSIFGSETKQDYPESLVKEAIERAVDGTDPWLRAVSGYRKKLKPAVVRAIDHVVALVDALAPPLPVRLDKYSDDPRLKRFFISAEEVRHFLAADRSLAEYLAGPGGDAPRVFALMAMEKQEKVIFGAALSGDIVIKDVPQVTVSFDAHRLMDPWGDEAEVRRLLKRRAYDHLLSLALQRLGALKSERGALERRGALLQAKLNLLQREGWGFDPSQGAEKSGTGEVEDELARIEARLQEQGGEDHILERYLETVAGVLGRPAEALWSSSETIFVDRMGIKRSEAATDAPELNFAELHNAQGRSMVVMLVSLEGEELRGVRSSPANRRS
jgi:hypothetical protein